MRHSTVGRLLALSAVVGLLLALWSAAGESAAQSKFASDWLLPNLRALPASDIHFGAALVNGETREVLRLTTTTWNDGDGPLEVQASRPTGEIQLVDQIAYTAAGKRHVVPGRGGVVAWHPSHNHFHFNEYARYILEPRSVDIALPLRISKTTFCIRDTVRIDREQGAASQGGYRTCDQDVQGLSVGWGDTYPYVLREQWIDVDDMAGHAEFNGLYRLVIVVDPSDRLAETDEGDNISFVDVEIDFARRQVTVFEPENGTDAAAYETREQLPRR